MIGNTSSSFLARMRRKFFNWRLNREIFNGIFPHVQRESNEGYSFVGYEDMNAQTESFDVQKQFDTIERQIAALPKAYGECFRHVMHRDLSERLSMYAEVAKRRTEPATTNPGLIAKHA